MSKFFGITIDPWIPALNYKIYFFRDNSGIIEFNEIELFYKNELIKVVGGMDRAKKFGFMTVTNFMAEVKVRIYIIRVRNHSPLPMVHWLDSDLILKLFEIFENCKNCIAIW